VRYLKRIRPFLLGRREHDGFWVSYRGSPLAAGRLYDIARARIKAKFGKAMCLHDFRRAAATFLAMEFPEKIGLIPGVLQHASPQVSEQHYNLARSAKAGQRFAAHLAKERERLRPISEMRKDSKLNLAIGTGGLRRQAAKAAHTRDHDFPDDAAHAYREISLADFRTEEE
jgi:hypothetical protein